MDNNRVLVGMSGGIDSTATCLMLREQGFDVAGLTLRVWDGEGGGMEDGGNAAVSEAREVAARLGIPHYVADEREAFRRTVVADFIGEYLDGRTPNPCALCNPLFKFRALTEWADRLGCARIATGHYARLEERGGRVYVLAGKDPLKDQSYFLWRVGQEALRRCLFPLGGLTKEEVRAFLRQRGFEAKSAGRESMEVCFVEGDYRDFLRRHVPDLDRRVGPGRFVSPDGRVLGTHRGFPYYTVGQRKGLEIALGHPAYVLKLNPQKNTVMLGTAEQLKAERMLVEQLAPVDAQGFWNEKGLAVRIRHRSRPIPCTVVPLEGEADKGRAMVRFLGEASAVTPGQSAVFYAGDRVAGGALIASQRGIGQYKDTYI